MQLAPARTLLQRRVQRSDLRRRGAAHVIIISMLLVFIISAALTIDVPYMLLLRTELRTATDAAAKAGAEALSRTEEKSIAMTEARRYAALNRVGGSPFQIRNSDIAFGRVTRGANGSYDFQEGAEPPNAVKVDAGFGDGEQTGRIPLFFGNALGFNGFQAEHTAIAARQDVEVMLCLDRSGSMLFDMSGTDWVYPTPHPNLSDWWYWGTLWRNHLSPPHPTGSRWTVLANSVELFMNEAQRYRIKPRTGLVTWGSDYTMPIDPYRFYPASEVDVSLPPRDDHKWSQNELAIRNALAARTAEPMMGGTNMSAGLDHAVAVLQGDDASVLSNKIIILLTDGQWNSGRDPLDSARDANAAGITVHAVSMLSRDQDTVRRIAEITGGEFYIANDAAALQRAFREMARTLPVVLTN